MAWEGLVAMAGIGASRSGRSASGTRGSTAVGGESVAGHPGLDGRESRGSRENCGEREKCEKRERQETPESRENHFSGSPPVFHAPTPIPLRPPPPPPLAHSRPPSRTPPFGGPSSRPSGAEARPALRLAVPTRPAGRTRRTTLGAQGRTAAPPLWNSGTRRWCATQACGPFRGRRCARGLFSRGMQTPGGQKGPRRSPSPRNAEKTSGASPSGQRGRGGGTGGLSRPHQAPRSCSAPAALRRQSWRPGAPDPTAPRFRLARALAAAPCSSSEGA